MKTCNYLEKKLNLKYYGRHTGNVMSEEFLNKFISLK